MQRFRNWLSATNTAVRAGTFGAGMNCHIPLRVVMGNTSCDVDSAIGALVLAFYYQTKLG